MGAGKPAAKSTPLAGKYNQALSQQPPSNDVVSVFKAAATAAETQAAKKAAEAQAKIVTTPKPVATPIPKAPAPAAPVPKAAPAALTSEQKYEALLKEAAAARVRLGEINAKSAGGGLGAKSYRPAEIGEVDRLMETMGRGTTAEYNKRMGRDWEKAVANYTYTPPKSSYF